MKLNQKKLEFIFNLRRANVTDTKLLDVMEKIPRSHFIGNSFKKFALEDTGLPINCGQTATQPSVIGIMIQALEITPRCKILEIGTGSGYQTSILAKLGRRIYSVERFQKLSALARDAIKGLSITNVTLVCEDGTGGLDEQKPFDKIIVSAAVDDIPNVLLCQLKSNGILVAPVGSTDPMQTIVKVVKREANYEYTDLKKVKFLPIIEGKATLKMDHSLLS